MVHRKMDQAGRSTSRRFQCSQLCRCKHSARHHTLVCQHLLLSQTFTRHVQHVRTVRPHEHADPRLSDCITKGLELTWRAGAQQHNLWPLKRLQTATTLVFSIVRRKDV